MAGSDVKNSAKKIDDKIFKEAVDDFDRFEEFFQENLKKILSGAVLLVVILIIGLVAWNIVKQSRFKASASLSAAKTVDELKNAIAKYPSSEGVDIARLNLGMAYFKNKKFDEAKSAFDSLASNVSDPNMKGRALINSAYALSALGKSQDASSKFLEIGEMDDMPAFIKDEANLEAGRILFNMNKMDKAKKVLNLVGGKKINNFWARQAKMILQKIDAGTPPLKKIIATLKKSESKTSKKKINLKIKKK